jgi:hypothetical protein
MQMATRFQRNGHIRQQNQETLCIVADRAILTFFTSPQASVFRRCCAMAEDKQPNEFGASSSPVA